MKIAAFALAAALGVVAAYGQMVSGGGGGGSGTSGLGTPATASAAGSTEGTATVISSIVTVFTTVGAGQGAQLALPYQILINSGLNPMLVYPKTGGTITAYGASLGTDLPFTINVGAETAFSCPTPTNCFAAFSAFQ